jgi:hypothetical protein
MTSNEPRGNQETIDFITLACLLIGRLLKVGGYIDFHDYYWSHEKSPTMNPWVRRR